jgi:glutamate synthase domain-containing protein 3
VRGEVGKNFAAGMTGGLAYVFDDEGHFGESCNTATVEIEPLSGAEQEEVDALLRLLEMHRELTGSEQAADILEHWNDMRQRFLRVVPVEYRRVLARARAESGGERGRASVA